MRVREHAVIMTGSAETTVKRRDTEAADKSSDGNACHIDELSLKEAKNRVSFLSAVPLLLLQALISILPTFFCLGSIIYYS